MLTSRDAYSQLVFKYSAKKIDLQKEKTSLDKSIIYYSEILITFRNTFKTINIARVVQKKEYFDIEDTNNPKAKFYCACYLDIISRLIEIDKEIKQCNKFINLTWSAYKEVIRIYNKNRVETLLQGDILKLGRAGELKIIRKENYKPVERIDWGASNKLKKKLQEDNIPLFEVIKDENGKVVKAEGAKYIIKIDNRFDNWVHWSKARCSLPNTMLFSFRPCTTTDGFMHRLQAFVNADELNRLRYPLLKPKKAKQ